MAVTLLAQALTGDGLARQTRWHQPPPEMVGPLMYRARPAELRTDHFRVDRNNLQPIQAGWIGVTLGHTRNCVGHLEHLEQQTSGLWLVAELANQPPAALRYLSPEYTSRAAGVEIRGAALVEQPAQICMQPVTVIPGRLADASTRGLPEWQGEMLERAQQTARRRQGHGPLEVYDKANDATVALVAPDDWPRQSRGRVQADGLWHGRGGGITSVH